MSDRLTLMPRTVAGLVRFVLSSIARVRVHGLEGVPREGPLIVVANHLSNADPPLVGGWLTPALGRRMRFLAKEELFRGPVGAWLRNEGVIMVRAGGSDVDAYRAARGVLDRGEVLCIFPEGTRSRTGTLQEARPGVALLATRTRVPILPVGVSGTDRLIPPGSSRLDIGARITLRVGQPFQLQHDASLPRRAQMHAAGEEVMRRIAELVDERHRGRFGGVPPAGGEGATAPDEGPNGTGVRR